MKILAVKEGEQMIVGKDEQIKKLRQLYLNEDSSVDGNGDW